VNIPEGELLAKQSDCGCTPAPEELAGVSIRGTVATVSSDGSAVTIRHEELPGVMASGTHPFRTAAGLTDKLAPGREFFGRISERDGAWWLFDVRMIGAPARQP
jgi:hypothetical protein